VTVVRVRGEDSRGSTDPSRITNHQHGNMIIDLHVHTRHYSGCSSIEVDDLVERARAIGLDGVVLTEHGIHWNGEKLAPWQDRAQEQGLLLLAGQEVTCFRKGRRQGDFLVLGVHRSLGSNLSAKELIQVVHGEGGVVVAAHPYKPSRLGASYYGAGDEIYELELDAVELYHPEHDEEACRKVRAAADRLGIPMTGGSDAHELHMVGVCCTRFPMGVRSMERLVGELRAGRVEPLNGVPRP